MVHQQREGRNKYSIDLDRGRLTRRTLLKRTLGGVLMGAIVLPSTSCGNPPSITWMSEAEIAIDPDGQERVQRLLVDEYNSTNEDGIWVNYQPGSADSTQLYQAVSRQLKKGNGYPEVLSIDIDWVAEFASNKWIKPIDDWWPENERSHYLPQAIKAATYGNDHHIWAAPFRTDVGLLYYRTDLGIGAPKKWADLTTSEVRNAMKARNIQYGYVWQGAEYEGLICCFLEVLSSYGGSTYNPLGTILKDSSAIKDTLNQMKSWVDGISHGVIEPSGSSVCKGFKKSDALDQWTAGNAVFMRNWPFAIAFSNLKSSKVTENYQLAPLPSQAKACLGGWHLAINASASPERQDAAWKFIHWMLQPDAQMSAARVGALAVTLKDIYTNTYICDDSPCITDIKSYLDEKHIQLRPQHPKYLDISAAIRYYVYQALTGQISSAVAVSDLQRELNSILNGGVPTQYKPC